MKSSKNKVTAFFDGACAPINPKGHLGIGCYVVYEDEVIFEYSGYEPASNKTSNNVAEYLAFEKVLEFLIREEMQDERIEIFGDSDLVVKQMNGVWRIKNGLYVEVAKRCLDYLNEFSDIVIKWIPREQNSQADLLSNVEFENRGIKKFEKPKEHPKKGSSEYEYIEYLRLKKKFEGK